MAEPIDRKHIDDDVVYKTLFQQPEDDTISRQAAIDFINAGHLCNPNEPRWSDNELVNFLKSRPSAQPDLDEFCFTCKEYDQERHCCPRWNRVIRNALKDAQSEPRWIPMSERTPEDGQLVLVQFIGFANVNNLDRFGVIKFSLAGLKEHIVAWMPLQPYERSEDGSKAD